MMNIEGVKRDYSWGEIIYKPQSTYGPRMQTHYQLMLVHSGAVVIETDGVATEMEGGEVAFLDVGHMNFFSFSTKGSTHHSWVHAKQVCRHDPWESHIPGPIEVRPISRRMGFLVRELLQCTNRDHPILECLYANLAEAAFMEFLAESDRIPMKSRGHPSLDRAINHVRMAYGQACDLDTLGRVSGMSPQHLTRLFKQETGMTPIRYVWNVREEEGLRLLRETGLTISEVANHCGFQNPYHFSRRISKRFGQSPMALRRQFWKGR